MLNYNREACAISDPDLQRVIITGGFYTSNLLASNTVSVYGIKGWIEDLEPIGQGRYDHACTSFLSSEERVKEDFLFHCEKSVIFRSTI